MFVSKVFLKKIFNEYFIFKIDSIMLNSNDNVLFCSCIPTTTPAARVTIKTATTTTTTIINYQEANDLINVWPLYKFW